LRVTARITPSQQHRHDQLDFGDKNFSGVVKAYDPGGATSQDAYA